MKCCSAKLDDERIDEVAEAASAFVKWVAKFAVLCVLGWAVGSVLPFVGLAVWAALSG